MTENDQKETNAARTDLRQQGQDAVTGTRDTREAVRDAVVRALSRQPLKEGQVRDVVRTVLKGVLDTAPGEGAESAEALRQAAAGIDEALECAAMTSKLAIEEARSQAAAFSERDLRRVLDDLATMEWWYLETLGTIVKEGTKTSAHILADLADHLHRTDTRTAMPCAMRLPILGARSRHMFPPDHRMWCARPVGAAAGVARPEVMSAR